MYNNSIYIIVGVIMRSREKKKSIFPAILLILLVLAIFAGSVFVLCKTGLLDFKKLTNNEAEEAGPAPAVVMKKGYLADFNENVTVCDSYLYPVGSLPRGTEIEYFINENGNAQFDYEDVTYYVSPKSLSDSVENCVTENTMYVRTSVNLLDENNKLMAPLAKKGDSIKILGCNFVDEKGNADKYLVEYEGQQGYVGAQYLVYDKAVANMNYDHNGAYATHLERTDEYSGGSADNLDYFPREKGNFENNVMPEECRTLYICSWRVDEVDTYLEVAKDSAINAFCVDITDGTAIAYSSPVMEQYSPTTAENAYFTAEEYAACIKKIKDAGYYVIGRITTFNDEYFLKDHPECAIKDMQGNPFDLQATYWPSAYNRYAWQYKVDLALEAIELMGFNEIQYDYVRFPDMTDKYDAMGIIDYGNTYGETKAQAIQRFLMYAADRIHEKGAYISADVFGESAFTYVTAYGQYWPAISNVVDAISGMPYPDHFDESGSYKPWEHPYDTLYNWGACVAVRQEETASPAKVRTWLQAYDAIREPYNSYGAAEIAAQINGLKDAGVFDGFLTWHSGAEPYKYLDQLEGFSA